MVVLPISWDVDVRQKSKMAAKLPEVYTHVVPKTIHGFMITYETSKSPAIVADAIPRVENPRWRPTNRKYL